MIGRLLRWIVWRLPDDIIYWSIIRAWAHATTGEYSNQDATELQAQELLERWEEK